MDPGAKNKIQSSNRASQRTFGMIDCLHLIIQKCSCACGNKWDHSDLILASKTEGYLGGTPDPQQESKLPVLSMEENTSHYPYCFRCVPLALGKSWVSPIKLLMIQEGTKKAKLFEEELLS